MEAAELTRWRQLHPRYTYWCGSLLGGCGEPLTDRRYHSKVCHFAHHPHHTCTRTANGEDSADHLFMKRALHNWIGSQGCKGAVHLPKSATPPGSMIDVDLKGSLRQLRFRLRPDSNGSWGLAPGNTDAPGDKEADWVFGLGGPAPKELLDGVGYVFRIRFETHGAERCPYLGVQQRGKGTEWTPFATAALTTDGLSTPTVDEIRAARRRSTAGAPIQPAGGRSPRSRVM
ncbi:competence protein CoiA family protein [Streptomyces sp. NPDC047525]|uniref:competence protein CoiA family protein n=1 Tax=Streptomyces sp. NPDC047525 TaxID=3155264 RepID=UPI0033CB46C8